jgi:hypothetical protein
MKEMDVCLQIPHDVVVLSGVAMLASPGQSRSTQD